MVLTELVKRIRYLGRRSRFESELHQEMQFHIETRAAELEATGISRDEAVARARREFGSATHVRDITRDVWRFRMLDDLIDDLRFGARLLRKDVGFTIAAVSMLTLGIGVNTTVFSWVQTIVLNPLPGIANPGTVVAVAQADSNNTLLPQISYPDFLELAALRDAFAGVVGTRSAPALLEVSGQSLWVTAGVATANLFDVLGVEPEQGRTFRPDEDIGEGGHPVLVISHGLLERAFGGDPAIVGRAVRLNQQLFTVIGVAPESFQGVHSGTRTDVWAPATMHEAVLRFGSFTSRTFRWIEPMSRLRNDVTVDQAQAALTLLSRRLESAYPDSNTGVSFRAFPLSMSPFGGLAAFLPVLRIVFAMTGGVLLIVIVNLSCLLLARAARRQTEVTLRVTLGAGRRRLVRQFLTESMLLALIGCGGGLLFARSASHLLTSFMPSAAAPLAYSFSLNRGTVGFAVALALLTAIVFGLAPALAASRSDLVPALNATPRGASSGAAHHRVLRTLVGTEVALALVLLIGAGLCLKGFQHARQIDVGFDPRGIVGASLDLVPTGYSPDKARLFDEALRQRLAALPGITGVAFANTVPLGSTRTYTGNVDVEGREVRTVGTSIAPFVIASPGYFAVMRIPLLEGRDFDEADDALRPKVAIVNDAMARRYWPDIDPIGRRFRMAVGVAPSETFTVVGVARTSKYDALAEPPTPMVYVTYLQRPLASLFMTVLVRTVANPAGTVEALRREIHAIDPAVEPLSVMPLEQSIEPAFVSVRSAAAMLSILGLTALILSAIGLYGVTSYAVSQRSREIGIRMALGAQVRDAIAMVVKQGMLPVAIGVAIGELAATALSPLLARFLYGVSATDAVTFVIAAGLLSAVAAIACLVPARRVAQLEPVAAMRSE